MGLLASAVVLETASEVPDAGELHPVRRRDDSDRRAGDSRRSPAARGVSDSGQRVWHFLCTGVSGDVRAAGGGLAQRERSAAGLAARRGSLWISGDAAL